MGRTFFSDWDYGDESELVFIDTAWWSQSMWDNINESDNEYRAGIALHYETKTHSFADDKPDTRCADCDLQQIYAIEALGTPNKISDETIIYD